MGFCRSCCGNFWGSPPSPRLSERAASTAPSAASSSAASWDGEKEDVELEGQELEADDFQPHSEAQVDILTKKWITHVQRRAAKVWTRDEVLTMLRKIAESVSFTDDPILGDTLPSATCVQWHGDRSASSGLPVLPVPKPGTDPPAPSYVSRLLVFLFADDDSLRILKQSAAGGSYSMNCGNSSCIRLSHFVGYTPEWAKKYQPKNQKAASKAPPPTAKAKAAS